MGAGQSTSQAHPPSRALHVLRVTPSSPASKTSIEPFFDFVVGFEGDTRSSYHNIDVAQLERIVEQHEERTLNLLVWSSKNQNTRVVPIIPSRAWSQPFSTKQDEAAGPQPSLLGLSMRMCEPESAAENVWHVLDVMEGSPAESAGLVPMGDWILGWSGGVLSGENDFYELVEAHVDKPLRVYVYSYDFDTLREVVLIPNRHWGGEGLLGCVFGFGLLHRIPPQPADRVPGTIPEELRSTEEYEEQELFVPADAHPENHYIAEQVEHWRRDSHEHWNQGSQSTRPPYEHTPHSRDVVNVPEIVHSHHFDERIDHELDTPTTGERTPRPAGISRYHPAAPTNSTNRSLVNGTSTDLGSSVLHNDPSTDVSHLPSDTGSDEEDGLDGQASVADTDMTSRGSLTSVE